MKKLFVPFFMLVSFVFTNTASAQTNATTATHTATKPAAKKTPAKKKSTATKAKAATTSAATTAAAPAKKGQPKMTFKVKYMDFGKVKTGDKPTFTYEFTNTGDAPMDIDLCSGCECTEMEWTRTQIPPGGKGMIKAVFNTTKAEPADHKKPLTKYIDIILKQTVPPNNYPIVESVKFDVHIID